MPTSSVKRAHRPAPLFGSGAVSTRPFLPPAANATIYRKFRLELLAHALHYGSVKRGVNRARNISFHRPRWTFSRRLAGRRATVIGKPQPLPGMCD